MSLEAGDERKMLSWDGPVLWSWGVGVHSEDSGLGLGVGAPSDLMVAGATFVWDEGCHQL